MESVSKQQQQSVCLRLDKTDRRLVTAIEVIQFRRIFSFHQPLFIKEILKTQVQNRVSDDEYENADAHK